MRRILRLTGCVFITLSHAGSARAADVDEIRKLIPAAAAMSLKDFDKLATSATTPKPSDLQQKTLTLMLLTVKAATTDEKALEEFRYLNGVPKPSQLAKEITRFVYGRGRFRIALGPVTMIHADRITDCTCNVEGDKATGRVSFRVPNLFEGKVNYVARRREGKWRIEEFFMPAHQIHIALP
jgi:hypothetical protein